MLRRTIAIASLAYALSFGSTPSAHAASPLAASDLNAAISKSTDGGGLQRTNGWWWAVPVIVGGVILLDRHYRYQRYYDRRVYGW